MSLTPIRDPHNIESETLEIPTKVTLLDIEPKKCLKNRNGKVTHVKHEMSPNNLVKAKQQNGNPFETNISTSELFDIIKDGIEVKTFRKIYYIGKGDQKRFCGPVIQSIPRGSYAQITKNDSILVSQSVSGKTRVYEHHRKIIFLVGKKSSDYGLVICRNGCILIESGAYCLIDMPLFVIEPNGEYYSLKTKQRKLNLGQGGHVVFHVKQIPLVFVTLPKDIPNSIPIAQSLPDVKSSLTDSNKSPKQENCIEKKEKVIDSKQSSDNSSVIENISKEIENLMKELLQQIESQEIIKSSEEAKRAQINIRFESEGSVKLEEKSPESDLETEDLPLIVDKGSRESIELLDGVVRPVTPKTPEFDCIENLI